MIDPFGRAISYVRISVTDRCNLRCTYCMPNGYHGGEQPGDVLSYEEIRTIAEALVGLGVRKFRLTGGEPLVRRNLEVLVRYLAAFPEVDDLALSSNAVLLRDKAQALRDAGLRRVNISLDTLRPETFRKISVNASLDKVLDGIAAAEEAGLAPIKINTVVMRGVNHDEVADLAALTFEKPYHVRFIELMPFQHTGCGDYDQLHVPIGEITRQIPGIESARVDPFLDNPGPARLCALPGARGKIGFIAPMSWHFCGSCNRLRLTADGKIRNCLFSNKEMDIKALLRRGASKKELVEFFASAVWNKPRRHQLNVHRHSQNGRSMYAIGG